MASEIARGQLYLIRVRTPDGEAVELDCEPCADFARAVNLTLRVALLLAQPKEDRPFGLPTKLAFLRKSLRALFADPLDCVVEIVVPAPPSAFAPNGWRVLRTEQVRAYADLPAPTLVEDRLR